jgi:hypothetical protein
MPVKWYGRHRVLSDVRSSPITAPQVRTHALSMYVRIESYLYWIRLASSSPVLRALRAANIQLRRDATNLIFRSESQTHLLQSIAEQRTAIPQLLQLLFGVLSPHLGLRQAISPLVDPQVSDFHHRGRQNATNDEPQSSTPPCLVPRALILEKDEAANNSTAIP